MKNSLLALLLIFTGVLQGWSQEVPDLVKSMDITSPLHQAHVGQIKFTAKSVPLESLTETDFLTAYTLTPKSGLYINAFLDNSLTNYLHRLAPQLTATELHKTGCYQFAFYVDNRLIYQDNLHQGSLYPAVKDTATVLQRPFIARPMVGWWSEYLWNRFLNNGGQQALTDGQHVFKLEMRPYVKNPELKVGNVMAVGQIQLDVQLNPKIDISTITLNPIQPYPGLPVSAEKFAVNKIKELKGKTEAEIFKNITSVVVLKNGKLLIEEYFNNADRNTRHDVRSVGKSFASTAAGLAIRDGYLKSENQRLSEFYNLKAFANYSLRKETIQLKDLLTMSAVLQGNDDQDSSPGNEENMYPTQNWVKFTLDLPVDTRKPAGEWQYFTAGVVLLGDIIDKKVPGGLEKYADEKLFKPLGITQYKWQYTPQKVANTAGGIQMNALDFAKYGQLYQNRGQWNGQQIIPKAWVQKTFTRYKPIPGREGEYYGYLFWNKAYRVNGQNYETYYCAGNGGNKIFVFKDQPLVVVVTATAFGTPYGHAQVDKMMTDYILPAVLENGEK